MIRERVYKKVPVGGNQDRHMVRLEGPFVSMGTREFEEERYNLLKDLVQFPELLECGPARFQTLKVSYNGNSWIAELEAVVASPPST
jgi:hypothetical protein